MTTVADVLRDGAAVLREKGHCRHYAALNTGEVCLAMALMVGNGGLLPYPALEVMDYYVEAVMGYKRQVDDDADARFRQHLSVEWNNEAAKDGEEVAATMEKAAAWYEEQGDLQHAV